MAGYVPHYQKKNRIAAKRERELVHAIRHNFDQEKLTHAAEQFREAKIAAFRSRWALTTSGPSSDFSASSLARKDKSLAKWLEMSTQDIIDTYARKET